jgi:hypothetical protein
MYDFLMKGLLFTALAILAIFYFAKDGTSKKDK